jgi:hypothetical protein
MALLAARLRGSPDSGGGENVISIEAPNSNRVGSGTMTETSTEDAKGNAVSVKITEFDLFKNSYDSNGKTTVEGSEQVIAPGTEYTKTFYVKNAGGVPLLYTMEMDESFDEVKTEDGTVIDCPIEVKLYKGTESEEDSAYYLVGDKGDSG